MHAILEGEIENDKEAAKAYAWKVAREKGIA
jgi:hypothetical protein